MAFENTSIKEAVKQITAQELLLPAIQRNFVWGSDRIENYFDSIMRDYPLGNFIWWKLDKVLAKKYPFYKFLTHYHQRDKTQNENAQENIYSNNMWGILDGQQRLSSLYIGISGSLTYKKRGRGHWSNDYNFEKYQLYINVFYKTKKSDEEKEENPKRYGFKFINQQLSTEVSDKQLWIKVGDIFSCDTEKEVFAQVDELRKRINAKQDSTLIEYFDLKEERIKDLLIHCFNKFNNPELLYYFKVEETELDEVLNIFVRVNSGGLILSKSQLMLATLSGTWTEARDKVEKLVANLRNLGLQIDNDFVMRAALTLSDLPVLFKVGTFTTKNVNKVISQWENISSSLTKTAEFLKDLKLLSSKFELISKNAILPIAYYISKNGDIKSVSAQQNLRKYFVVSQVKGIFGSQGDGVLNKIRETLRIEISKGEFGLKKTKFSYGDLLNVSFSGDKSFKLDRDFIDDIVETKYGSHAYFLLTLLYPDIDYDKNLLDMDHIHPISKFNKSKLKDLGVQREEDVDRWHDMGNSLPNLQLLTSRTNKKKQAKPLAEYLETIENKSTFIKDNFLPKTDYSFSNFENFFEKRKKNMVDKLESIFND